MSAVLVRLCRTPLRDVVRGRITGRLDLEAMIAAAALPDPLPRLVRDVTRRTRLSRLEKVAVAEELTGHFRDGLNQDGSPDELARDFGDIAQAARLIGRAKRRNRPLAYRATIRSMQAACGLVGFVLLLYSIAAIRFFAGKPNLAVDYLKLVNAETLAAPPADRAWPEYRAAILSLQRPPELSSRRTPRPGEPGWEVVEAYLVGSRSALERIRAGAARPVLGYEIGFAIAPQDSQLWPDRAGMAKPPKRPPLWGVLMPHLAEMRHLVPFMVDDTRRAAFHGEPETALANIEAMLSMAEQLLDAGFALNDLVALAMFTEAVMVTGELVGDYPDLFDDEQLTALAHRLGRTPTGVSIAGERFAFADVVQQAYTDDGRGDGHLTWDGLKLWLNWLDVSKPPDGVAMAAGPAIGVFCASRAELVGKYDQVLAMVQADAMLPLWKRGKSLAEAEIYRIKSSVTESVRFLPIALLMPSLGKIGVNAELLTQRRDATLVAIALQMYRRRHGEWPSELDALVPLFLPRVPPDRFDGGPMKYVLRNGDPVLYVVGTDRDDDGGRTPPPPNTERAKLWQPLDDFEVAAGRSDLRSSVTDGDWVLWPLADPPPLGPPVPSSPIYWFHRHRP
ncbi:MAG: hypothetical protein V3S08_04525 [Phycisphaerales bacterium]